MKKNYIYNPQKDITAYELALILPLLIHPAEDYLNSLDDEEKKLVLEHFKVKEKK